MKRLAALATVALSALALTRATAQSVTVPNPSFELGGKAPEPWTLSDRNGLWATEGHTGNRSVTVTGTGETSNYWSVPLPKLEPGKTYRMSFWARSPGASGGCIISGPNFCNRDYSPHDGWEQHTSVFTVPASPGDSYLRLGQWMVKGTVAFDDIAITEVAPVHLNENGLVLGAGESIEGRRYTARHEMGGPGSNYCRFLVEFTAQFNSTRWVFGGDNAVVYRHGVGQRQMRGAEVTVNVGYYSGGKCLVEASRDGGEFAAVGEIGQVATRTFALPADLFPAREVRIRLRSTAAADRKGDSAPGSFQVHAYTFAADLEGEPLSVGGVTTYLDVARRTPSLTVNVESLGSLRPGAGARARIGLHTQGGKSQALTVRLELGGSPFSTSGALGANAATVVEIPYELQRAGEYPLALTVTDGDTELYRATGRFTVPHLFDASYGYRVQGAPAEFGLWWCEATYKVSRDRGLPRAVRPAIQLNAARNEYEPVQLVLRPGRRLDQVTVSVSDLTGPGGASIARSNVTVCRVEYVRVTHPTDAAGCPGWWPDPLPPLTAPVSLEPKGNQPLWLTVYVPAEAKAGDYVGDITVTAGDQTVRVPLRLHVWDFALPSTTTLRSGFGLSAGNIYRYQNLTEPADRRAVLDKYYRNLAAHRMCPYDAMRPIRATFSGSQWSGGNVVRDQAHAGLQSLYVDDSNAKGVVSATYAGTLKVDPARKYVIAWWCRTEEPGQKCQVTVDQRDADGHWRSGHNRDVAREGTGEWRREEAVVAFDAGTLYTGICLRPTVWTEDGRATGKAWFDDVSFALVDDGKNLLTDSDFESTAEKTTVTHDFRDFDEDARHCLDELGYNSFRLPVTGLGGGTFHSRSAGSLAGFKAGTPEYATVFTRYLRPIQEHLREKGWLEKAYVYWFDEPAPNDYDFVREGMRTLDRAAPDLCRLLTVKPVPALYGDVDRWCIPVGNFAPDVGRERQSHGDDIWWYLCCGPHTPYIGLFIDHPAIDFRLWSWMSWKWRVTGLLIWETTYWTSPAAYPDSLQNPWEDPMSYVSGYGTPAGTKAFWGNGDGRLFYPPNRDPGKSSGKILDGPVNSIRAELLREGIEDYEYFQLLSTLALRSSQAAAADSARLLTIPTELIADLTHYSTDPQPLYAYRAKVAAAIEALLRAK